MHHTCWPEWLSNVYMIEEPPGVLQCCTEIPTIIDPSATGSIIVGVSVSMATHVDIARCVAKSKPVVGPHST
jgi:hypothetical protein